MLARGVPGRHVARGSLPSSRHRLRVHCVYSSQPPKPSSGNGDADPKREGLERAKQSRRDGQGQRRRGRDRLVGLLTERSAKTLLVYLMETNPTIYHWLFCYLKDHPIPHRGSWDEVSGEVFLRGLLSKPITTAKIELNRSSLFDNMAVQGVDPRHIAQRIMDIRVQLSKEFTQDLSRVQDENGILLRETLSVSLANTPEDPAKAQVFIHPELLTRSGNLHPDVAQSHPELAQAVKQRSPSPAPGATAADGEARRDGTPSRSLSPPPFARANSKKGKMFSGQNRRKGRDAIMRTPDDSPLRDGNRDRLIGLLTERSAKTLLAEMRESNATVYQWLFCFMKENPIPSLGTWDEISGEVFLRKMLSEPTVPAAAELGAAQSSEPGASVELNPRQLAQQIMDMRVRLSQDFVQDLSKVQDENSVLLRETLQVSLANTLPKNPTELPPRDVSKVFIHPELLTQGGALHPEVAQSHPELVKVIKLRSASPKPVSASAGAAGDAPAPPEAPSDDRKPPKV